ncbi:MAG TPA: type VI secretion system baseplate subunit TssG [Verrucomicrobiae bacterium]|jgi:type VI secretion system protein ImpH|nr:type VI secretion system baseplate subunit TssG [Verrucomicrobiae bacterium]
MADIQRHAPDPLIESLRGKNCCGYDFFKVVRLLQRARPGLPSIGCSKTPDDDPIRFCQRPSLGFAPSTLDELVVDEKDPSKPPRLYVNFMGLFGPNGPLPLHLTEYAIRRRLGHIVADPTGHDNPGATQGYVKSDSFSDFFDVFHHRLISLFFRAWAVSQPTIDLDRSECQRFLFFLGSLSGESNSVPEDRLQADDDVIPARDKAYYVGRLACPSRNAEGLEAILSDYFTIPTSVREFVGHWFELPPEDLCQLGRGSAGQLGRNVFVGARTWAVHLGFRLRMGPMGLDDYLSLLPTGKSFPLLKGWVTDYCGVELFWDVQLVLRADEVPHTILGRSGRLGWTTWLRSDSSVEGSPGREVDDLILVPPETLN